VSGQRFAVLIAGSRFPEEPALSELRCPERDVDGLRELLSAKESGDFTQVTVLKNPPHSQALMTIYQVLNAAGKDDLVLIYYSGHGKLDRAGRLHLATSDTRVDALAPTAIPVHSVRDYIETSASRKVILVLDCCFSGAAGAAFAKGGVDDQMQVAQGGRGFYLMTASTAIQVAEEKEGEQHSVFTKHILQGIRSGEADEDDDGWVGVEELYRHVHRAMRNEGFQEPLKWDLNVSGEILVARSGRASRNERRQQVRQLLLELAGKGLLPDPILAKAFEVIAQERRALSTLDLKRDELLDRLLQGRLSLGDLVHAWYGLDQPKVEPPVAAPPVEPPPHQPAPPPPPPPPPLETERPPVTTEAPPLTASPPPPQPELMPAREAFSILIPVQAAACCLPWFLSGGPVSFPVALGALILALAGLQRGWPAALFGAVTMATPFVLVSAPSAALVVVPLICTLAALCLWRTGVEQTLPARLVLGTLAALQAPAALAVYFLSRHLQVPWMEASDPVVTFAPAQIAGGTLMILLAIPRRFRLGMVLGATAIVAQPFLLAAWYEGGWVVALLVLGGIWLALGASCVVSLRRWDDESPLTQDEVVRHLMVLEVALWALLGVGGESAGRLGLASFAALSPGWHVVGFIGMALALAAAPRQRTQATVFGGLSALFCLLAVPMLQQHFRGLLTLPNLLFVVLGLFALRSLRPGTPAARPYSIINP